MNSKTPVINHDDPVGKTVGRRKMPDSPFDPRLSSKELVEQWQKELPAQMHPRGVFRFKSHEEADAWWTKTNNQKKS